MGFNAKHPVAGFVRFRQPIQEQWVGDVEDAVIASLNVELESGSGAGTIPRGETWARHAVRRAIQTTLSAAVGRMDVSPLVEILKVRGDAPRNSLHHPDSLEQSILEWHRAKYGGDARAAPTVRHLLEEVGELVEAMLAGESVDRVAEEAADVGLILTNLLRSTQGRSLYDAMVGKHRECWRRLAAEKAAQAPGTVIWPEPAPRADEPKFTSQHVAKAERQLREEMGGMEPPALNVADRAAKLADMERAMEGGSK